MKPAAFNYKRPDSLKDAIAMLSDAGPAGRVIGLDQQQSSLDAARRWLDGLAGNFGNVSFQRGGILANELPAESFDFAHLRFVLTTVG